MMDVGPEMRELRDMLARNGLEYTIMDDEYGIDYDDGEPVVVNADACASKRLLDGLTHVERTTFRATDGRDFEVTYAWTRDDDDRKVFCSMHGNIGYLEVRVGDDAPYSAYAEDIIEYATRHDPYAD